MKNEKVVAMLKTLVIIGLTVMFGYYYTETRRGGIMDDSLLNHNDPYYKMDKAVKALKSKGLKMGEAINFIIPFNGLNYESLSRVKTFTDKLKDEFPEYGILSLSTAANYRNESEELIADPYIDRAFLEKVKNDSFEIASWEDKVMSDAGVYGLLIGRNFNYASVIMMLPEGYDEIAIFRKVTEFLENRKISKFEWFYKKDIIPVGEFTAVMVSGWVMARGLMDAALNADILMFSVVGFALTWLLFAANFLSWRQASIASISVFLGLVWASGSIGLLQSFGCRLSLRVYFLLVFTAIIVAGISFAARKLDAYNEARKIYPGLSRSEVWAKTSLVHGPIFLTAIIAIFNFGTLYQIEIRGILEVGIFAALGIAYLLILTRVFMPALHVLIGGELKEKKSGGTSRWWHVFLEKTVSSCYRFSDPRPLEEFDPVKPKRRSLAIICMVFVVAVVLVGLDYIPGINILDSITGMEKGAKFLEINTRPIEYIKGTIIDRASDLLNKPENSGFDRVSFLVRPKIAKIKDEPVSDPEFIAQIDRFKKKVFEIKGVREAHSAADTVKVVTRELHEREMPESAQEAHDALAQMDSGLDPLVKEQLWYNGGLVVYISTTADDSKELGALIDQVLKLAESEFKESDVITFGKVSLYPRADEYIRVGKPINVLTSQWVVFAIYGFYIFWRNRKIKELKSELRLSWWRTGLVMNAPFFFATSVIAIVMVIFRVPLDQATACISALAVNAAADFGLYLVVDYQTKLAEGWDERHSLQYALLRRGDIIMADVVLNAVCFAPLMLSNFIPVIRLGWIMVVMLGACGFGALVLMPALLPWAVRKK